MARKKTNLIHKAEGVIYEVSREVGTNKLFIKGTNTEVPPNKVNRKNNQNSKENYDYAKPFDHQSQDDEWSDYAWSADDF